jgi:hypothetical protein
VLWAAECGDVRLREAQFLTNLWQGVPELDNWTLCLCVFATGHEHGRSACHARVSITDQQPGLEVGACWAGRRHSASTWRSTGRVRSSRLRTLQVAASSSSEVSSRGRPRPTVAGSSRPEDATAGVGFVVADNKSCSSCHPITCRWPLIVPLDHQTVLLDPPQPVWILGYPAPVEPRPWSAA